MKGHPLVEKTGVELMDNWCAPYGRAFGLPDQRRDKCADLVEVRSVMDGYSLFRESVAGQERLFHPPDGQLTYENRPLISGQFRVFSNNGLNATLTKKKL